MKAAAALLTKKGVRSIGQSVDVADAKAVKAWVGAVAAAFGGIDIIIANVSALAISGDEEGWRRGFEVDLMHSVRLVNAAMPWLEKSSAGARSSRFPASAVGKSISRPGLTAPSRRR